MTVPVAGDVGFADLFAPTGSAAGPGDAVAEPARGLDSRRFPLVPRLLGPRLLGPWLLAPWLLAPWLLALSVAATGVWLTAVGFDDLRRARDLLGALRVAQGRMVGPALVATVVVLFAVERLRPAVRRPAMARAHLVDAGYLLLFALIAPLITLLDTGFAVVAYRYAPFLMPGRLPLGPRVVVVVLVLVGIDAMNWAAHVLNHRSSTLWRFHALHHSQEDMSVLTTFRTHPFAHVSYLLALVPALVLAASGTVPGIGIIVYGCLVTLPHANLRWTFGPLRKILVSPAYHRLHHSAGPVAGRMAVNFGFVLVCWDRLAGVAVQPGGGGPVRTGIASRPVPIEQSATTPGEVGRVFIAQLAQPLLLRFGPGVRSEVRP